MHQHPHRLHPANHDNAAPNVGNRTHSTCHPSDTAAPHPDPSGSDSNPPPTAPATTAPTRRRQPRATCSPHDNPAVAGHAFNRSNRNVAFDAASSSAINSARTRSIGTGVAACHTPRSPASAPGGADHSNNNHPGRSIAASRNLGNNGVASSFARAEHHHLADCRS